MQLIRKQVLLLTLSWLYSKESQQLYSAAGCTLGESAYLYVEA